MAIVDGEKRLTLLDLYNDITGQAWSMFDSEVEDEDEFETNVMTSIRKALSDLWNSYNFPFRERTHLILTKAGGASYAIPDSATENNIVQTRVNGKHCYSVFCDYQPLKYDADCRFEEAKSGKPEKFYFKQDKIYLYPTPDDRYPVTIDYMSMYPVISEDGDEKATLEHETDYIYIPEKYQELFECTLMPLAMWNYLIASETDENSEAYKIQYERAYKQLIKACRGLESDKTIGWKD
jgi:hypothetical protein